MHWLNENYVELYLQVITNEKRRNRERERDREKERKRERYIDKGEIETEKEVKLNK